jgi:hypothetical protein
VCDFFDYVPWQFSAREKEETSCRQRKKKKIRKGISMHNHGWMQRANHYHIPAKSNQERPSCEYSVTVHASSMLLPQLV